MPLGNKGFPDKCIGSSTRVEDSSHSLRSIRPELTAEGRTKGTHGRWQLGEKPEMKTIKEIGLVAENGPDQLSLVSELFDANGIRMIGFYVNNEEKKCGLRIVVNDPEKAVNVLTTAGYDLQVTDVIACELPDHPGGLNAILNPLKSANIDVDYIYPCLGTGEATILIIVTGALKEALGVMEENWIRVYGSELYSFY
jgi:hypothetical protein